MRKAEIAARKRNKDVVEEVAASSSQMDELEPKEGVKLSIWNAIIPIGTLIISALVAFYYSGYSSIMGGDNVALQQLMSNSPMSFTGIMEAFSAADASVALFQSALFASVVTIIMAVCKKIFTLMSNSPMSFTGIMEAFSAADASVALFQSALFASVVTIIMAVCKKIFTLSEAIDTWVDGMKGLIITGVILILAWSLGSVIKELGTAYYLVEALKGAIPAFLLPSLIFVLGAVISFSTGTAYGTMSILMPLAIPLAHSINPEMSFIVVCTSAVLTGAIFGDHCSPISDTTILSSMGAGCNHINHVNTQIWYSLFVAVITIVFGYIPAGLGLPIYLVLPLSLVAVYVGVQIFGKKVDEATIEAESGALAK